MKVSIFVLSVLLAVLSLSAADPLDGFSGYWKTVDDKTGEVRSIVRLERVGNELLGYVHKAMPRPGEPTDPICDKCPGERRNQKIIGMNFMWGFRLDGQSLSDGQVLDPENGKIYHCRLELIDGGQKLKVFGYIKVLFKIGRSQVWVRVASPSS